MAIDDLLVDEHEQSERVRNWLRNNGIGIIAGIALVVVAGVGAARSGARTDEATVPAAAGA